jgi:hypothetical protein
MAIPTQAPVSIHAHALNFSCLLHPSLFVHICKGSLIVFRHIWNFFPMRLLHIQTDGGFHLVNYVGRNFPPYAILSHTWGRDEDEVTMSDLVHNTGSNKAGYRKLNFCSKQAASDHLEYFWVDTCCIDKSSSNELQEAINSMSRWYRDATKCYVYLEDVSEESLRENSLSFQKSRWFTRGWTLQELLAPKSVEFFSAEGILLGSRSSRLQEVAQITHIPVEALEGKAFSSFSVDERMGWAEGRETTREEDMAYSLFGIFDIQMPLLYGEGQKKAFRRLHRDIRESLEDGAFAPPKDAHNGTGSPGNSVDNNVQQSIRQLFRESQGRTKLVKDTAPDAAAFERVLKKSTALETNKFFTFLMGDSDKDGPPDLIAIKRHEYNDSIEVHVLSGASNYQNFALQVQSPIKEKWTTQLEFMLTDWNGDGELDIVMIKKDFCGTNMTEVHIVSGASNYQHWMVQVGTGLHETDDTFAFAMGRFRPRSRPDLFAIKRAKTDTNSMQVNVLSGKSSFQDFILQVDTGLHEFGPSFDFALTNWNAYRRPDLVAIKKSSSSSVPTEIHVLSGASLYKKSILRAEVPLYRTNGLFEFALADWTRDGRPDLVAVQTNDTRSKRTEVSVFQFLTE